MNIKIFVGLVRLYNWADDKVEMRKIYISYKKRAIYSIVAGFARAGVYLMS